jgi:phage-related protein
MGFFSNIGSNIANVAERIGHTVKSGWQTIGSTIKNVNSGVGKVAGVVQHLTAGSSNPYMKAIHDGAGQVVNMSDIVSQGHNVADKFVSRLERASKDVSDTGKGNISPSQLKDRLNSQYRGARDDMRNGLHLR